MLGIGFMVIGLILQQPAPRPEGLNWLVLRNLTSSGDVPEFDIDPAGPAPPADLDRDIGGVHHRRPAMEVVRQIVDRRSAGRNYEHRLRDYNNDPSTTIGDVRSLFEEALSRLER